MRAVTVCALAALLMASTSASPNLMQAFAAFKKQYNRHYSSPQEEAKRFKTFVANMKKAEELQVVNPHAKFGANEFADMSEAEFKIRHSGERVYKKAIKAAKHLKTKKMTEAQIKAAANEKQDWRAKGAVTPVKNQGNCGSCWSFSTTGGIEGQWFLAGNALTSVSEQELVSCDTIDSGCQGGLMDNAFTWLLQTHNGSIVTEASYPYVSGGGSVPACSMTGTAAGATISSFQNIASSEATMAAFVYTSGPLSIAVDAESWQTYQGGIMTNCASGQLDHGVLIVGYDQTSTPPYWIIKNSWGASWGESGYIRVEYGQGQCSIGQYQTTAVVTPSGPTPAPAPPTPAPTGPTPPGPTPPSPSTGAFVQMTCSDPSCKACSEQSFATNTCVNRGTTSFKAICATDAVIVESFAQANCQGYPVVTSNPRDTCSIIFEKEGTEHFVQNQCRSGPAPTSTPTAAPTTTQAPQPPAPTPTPASNATFTQMQCSDAACTQNCESQTFPQNSCLQLSSGGSATAVCQPTDLLLTIYTSSDCSGAGQQDPQQINTCTQDNSGSYLENVCPTSAAAVEAAIQTRGMKLAKR
jgi:cysteine peptidase B